MLTLMLTYIHSFFKVHIISHILGHRYKTKTVNEYNKNELLKIEILI